MRKRTVKSTILTIALGLSIVLLAMVGQGPAAGRIADIRISDELVTGAEQSLILPWYMERIGVADAWQTTGGGDEIVVAILDTGIDATHEELQGKVTASVNFTGSKTTADVNGHGTIVAGIIAAAIENLKGVTGIAYQSTLLNVKVAGDDGFVEPAAVAKGIIWAVDNGARVINLSLTLSKPSVAVEEAVQYAWSKGAVIVAAAGNGASTIPVYPAAYEKVLAVAATDQEDRLTRWSNKGEWVNVTAPGVDIYSTLPRDKYIYKAGTSYATALTTGEATLLFVIARDTNQNGYTNDEVLGAILRNTDAGRINVLKAVTALQ